MTTVTLNIPEGVTGHDVVVEAACRLYDAQQLTKTQASRMCGLNRTEFDAALVQRGLPVIRYTREMLEQDLRHAGLALPPDEGARP
jgi:predicted HTH domain antitoxin